MSGAAPDRDERVDLRLGGTFRLAFTGQPDPPALGQPKGPDPGRRCLVSGSRRTAPHQSVLRAIALLAPRQAALHPTGNAPTGRTPPPGLVETLVLNVWSGLRDRSERPHRGFHEHPTTHRSRSELVNGAPFGAP